MPSTTVIIVAWNSADHLSECLSGLRELLDAGRLYVVVVDNASVDESVRVAESFSGISVVRNTENVGFARANNQVLRSLSTDYALLLNPDARLSPEALRVMLDYADQHRQAGAVGPCLVDPGRRFRVKNGGWAPTTRSVLCHFLGISRLYPRVGWARGFQRNIDPAGPEIQDWLSGACLLLRRKALLESGLLDERWFLYMEDVDLCERISRAGWQVVYLPGIEMVHLVGGGRRGPHGAAPAAPRPGSWIRSLRAYYLWRNRPSAVSLALFDAAVAAGLLTRGLVYLLRSTGLAGETWRQEAGAFFGHTRELIAIRWHRDSDGDLMTPKVASLNADATRGSD